MGFASPPHDGFALSQRTRMRVQAHMIPTADESPMNFAPFSALFLANFRESPDRELRRIL
jgi:hypothetical protein